MKLWDLRTPLETPVQTLRGFRHFPQSIAASNSEHESNSTYLLTSRKGLNGVGYEAQVWDRRTGKQVVKFEGGDHDAIGCCFLPITVDQSSNEDDRESSGRLPLPVTASTDGIVKVRDASSLSPLAEAYAEGAPKCMITSLCTVDKGTLLASTISGQVLAYSLDRKRQTLALQPR